MSGMIPDKDDKREKLPMETRFNQWAYGGISYFAQAFTGSALTYWMKFSKSGRPLFDKIANWVGPNLISKVTSLKGKKAVDGADVFITISTMVMMGNLFLIPLKWVEDRKAEIVEKWTNADNHKREASGEIIAPEEKAHQQELLAELKAEPQQTWWSLLRARAFSLATVYAVYFGIGDPMNQKIEAKFSGAVRKGMADVGLKTISENKVLKNVMNLAFFEVIYSMISAGGLFVYSHFVMPPEEERKEALAAMPKAPATVLASEDTNEKLHQSRIAKKLESFAANIAAQHTANAEMAI